MQHDYFGHHGHQTQMSVNGLHCTLNLPKALERKFGRSEQEVTQDLPPGAPRVAFNVDDYPSCPENWMRGGTNPEGIQTTSYFVPIKVWHGMWLDFNENTRYGQTHHVAVMISIQGINPITGRKTDAMRLEQYKSNCPIHDVPFGSERFCAACGYKWDAQNYLAGNATPERSFWLDGFRAEDGVTRQYVFTEEQMQGVAAQLIGDERVFAIGVAFFLSKEAKPPPPQPVYRLYDTPIAQSYGLESMVSGVPRTLATKSVEIGAGAKIDQRIYPDPESLDFWQDSPAGLLYINYVPEEQAQQIIEAGKLDRTADGEGFMQGLNSAI